MRSPLQIEKPAQSKMAVSRKRNQNGFSFAVFFVFVNAGIYGNGYALTALKIPNLIFYILARPTGLVWFDYFRSK